MKSLFSIFFVALLLSFTSSGLVAATTYRNAKGNGQEKNVQERAGAKKENIADKSDDFETKLEKLPGDNFKQVWPKVTKLVDMLPAKVIKEEGRENIYETEHFQFICTAPIALSSLRQIARIFEGTYVANLALPINSPCNYYQVAEKGKLRACLFETRQEYLKAAGDGLESSKGVCRVASNMERSTILVPYASLGLEKSGSRYKKASRKVESHTLAHELTHFMTMPGYAYPIWFCEGIAEYVGTTSDATGRFSFSNNKKDIIAYATSYGKDKKGGRNLGKKIASPKLERFLKQSHAEFMAGNAQFNYGFSMLLVYYFFHIDGKKDAARIKEFLKVCQKEGPNDNAHKKLLDGRTWEQLEKDVAKGLKLMGIVVEFK